MTEKTPEQIAQARSLASEILRAAQGFLSPGDPAWILMSALATAFAKCLVVDVKQCFEAGLGTKEECLERSLASCKNIEAYVTTRILEDGNAIH